MKLNKNQVKKEVYKIISETLKVNINTIKDNSKIMDDIGADSIEVVELIMALETTFKLEISDDESKKLQTVKNIIDFVMTQKPDDDDVDEFRVKLKIKKMTPGSKLLAMFKRRK